MTSLLTHTVTHITSYSFRRKTNNQPLKKFLSLSVSWVKVVKNWMSYFLLIHHSDCFYKQVSVDSNSFRFRSYILHHNSGHARIQHCNRSRLAFFHFTVCLVTNWLCFWKLIYVNSMYLPSFFLTGLVISGSWSLFLKLFPIFLAFFCK